MTSSGRHPEKEIADALRRARDAGLEVVEIHRGHRWGMLRCGSCSARHPVWSTPRNPGAFARRLDRFTRRHSHDSGMGNVVKFHRREDEA